MSLGLPGPSQETEKSRLTRNPVGWPRKIRTAGLADNFLFLVLAPAGTAGTALLHHSLAALMEDSSAFLTPEKRASRPLSDSPLDVPGLRWPGPRQNPQRGCVLSAAHTHTYCPPTLLESTSDTGPISDGTPLILRVLLHSL